MKKISFALIILTIIAIFPSCKKQDSNDVNQDKIWTQYVLLFNKNNDVTDVVARFRFGGATGTLLNLTDSTGASVTFNGQAMPYSDWWGGHHLQFAGNVTSGTFKYTNTNGTVYTNTFPSTSDTIAFKAGFDTISKANASTFSWAGNALTTNQSVGIYVGTWAWDKDAMFYTDADGATSMVFGATEKSGLSVGSSTVYMNLYDKSTSINGTSTGGIIQYTYQVQKANVQIVP